MALSGIQIYKMLPQTNCKECGFPTCLAFAMKLAAKQVELSTCPYVSEASKAQLAESSAPPMRLVTLKAGSGEVKVGNETVLFRHEKTFINKPGLFVRVKDSLSAAEIQAKVAPAEAYAVNYVGMDLTIDGFAVESTGTADAFAAAAATVRKASARPLTLIASDPVVMAAGLAALPAGESPLIYAADAANWEAMTALAAKYNAALVVAAPSVEALADLTEKVKGKGVENLVLDVPAVTLGGMLASATVTRRLALKKNFRAVGYPLTMNISNPDPGLALVLASQALAKYGGFVIIDEFSPETVYPLLVLRQNIYTDPQKPIQVQPGLYEINNPTAESPVLVTTNFSITYFSVANEVEGSGLAAHLLVVDAEGMSVLTAWAAGKFDAERIAKGVKAADLASKVTRKRVVLPGHVAVLSGEVEEELQGWEVRVGPREAVDLPMFMKKAL
jgi:acetyl-CoA decarbonylase/synthase complex subunit gamma